MGVVISGLNNGPVSNLECSINNGEFTLIVGDQNSGIDFVKDALLLKTDPNNFVYRVDGTQVTTQEIRLSDVSHVCVKEFLRSSTVIDSMRSIIKGYTKRYLVDSNGHSRFGIDEELLNRIAKDEIYMKKYACDDEWYIDYMHNLQELKNEVKRKKVPLPICKPTDIDTKIKTILEFEFFEYMDELLPRKGSEIAFGQRARFAILCAIATEKKFLVFDDLFDYHPNIRRTFVLEFSNLLKKLGLSGVYFSHLIDDSAKVFDKVIIMKDNKIARIGRFN